MTDDVCGIYLITNKNTGQMYVGQSIDIQKRFGEHRRATKLGHSRVDNAIHKYGAENFSFEIIMTIENDTEKLNDAEREWIAILNTYEDDSHYHLTPGGDFNPMKVPEIVKKISGENNPNYGGLLDEHRQKISEAHKGKKHPEETRKKMSRAQNKTGFFRVCKRKNSKCKQGFYYSYQYFGDDEKRHAISSVDIKKLEQKVRAKGLTWLKFEEE